MMIIGAPQCRQMKAGRTAGAVSSGSRPDGTRTIHPSGRAGGATGHV